jgi:hypothetical protein
MRIWICAIVVFLAVWFGLFLVWGKRFADPAQVHEALDRSASFIAGYQLGRESLSPFETNYNHWDESQRSGPLAHDIWPCFSHDAQSKWNRFRLVSVRSSTEVSGGKLATLEPVNWPLGLGAEVSTFVAFQGVARSGSLTLENYSWVVSLGRMEGTILNKSYSTILIDGELSGELTSDSYLCAVVTGPVTGKISSSNYAMIYLLGGLQGTIDLGPSRVYITGRTVQSELSRIIAQPKFLKHSGVYLEESDLPAGDQIVGNLRVTVGKSDSGH